MAKAIKECVDLKKIKNHGDRIDTTEQLESIKVETMKCILVSKFTFPTPRV